jgi:hypothetical protein
MTPELIIGVVIAALLVYAIATHKIDLAKLKGDITSHLAAVHATAQATHSAALAPVSVVSVAQPVAPSDPAAVVARGGSADPECAARSRPCQWWQHRAFRWPCVARGCHRFGKPLRPVCRDGR